ncbi:MAG: O-antigen ligase domain-containing protein [Bacteroidales bacterium]|nr:O-antigen ligase domain-containing protein [Bacteroidales bacterium]
MDLKNTISENFNKAFAFAVLIFLVALFLRVTLNISHIVGLAISLVPLGIITLLLFIDKPYYSLMLIFTANYFVSGLSRYVNIAPGITMDIIMVFTIIIISLQVFKSGKETKLSNALNRLTMLVFIWFLFCLFQILNPESSSPLAWVVNVRGISVYFLLVTALASIILRSYKDLKKILFIWAVFCLLAVSKALMQKLFGFDFAERIWLAEGGANTHIIHTGIRYFSFFTDAGNFGSGIAFSMLIFAITAFQVKDKRLRNFYLFVAGACAYGMIISGTRGSLIIPFSGLTLYTLLSRNIKIIIPTFAFLLIGFWFLNFTYIGHGNTYIRRMRSVFNPDDASLQVRLQNQRLLRTAMIGKPLGVGIGMSRGNAVLYSPHPILSQIPQDSWYVLLWVETGLVGMFLYILMLLYIIGSGIYLILIKLKDPELRGIITAFVCALFGVSLAAYSLEIFGQFPNSILIYIVMTFIFLSPVYDKELEDKRIAEENNKV